MKMRMITDREWYRLVELTNGDDSKMHWKKMASHVLEANQSCHLPEGLSARCGDDSSSCQDHGLAADRYNGLGFRPTLENADGTIRDGDTVVIGTLYMNEMPVRVPQNPTCDGDVSDYIPGAKLEMREPVNDPAYQVTGIKDGDKVYADRNLLKNISYQDVHQALVNRTFTKWLKSGDLSPFRSVLNPYDLPVMILRIPRAANLDTLLCATDPDGACDAALGMKPWGLYEKKSSTLYLVNKRTKGELHKIMDRCGDSGDSSLIVKTYEELCNAIADAINAEWNRQVPDKKTLLQLLDKMDPEQKVRCGHCNLAWSADLIEEKAIHAVINPNTLPLYGWAEYDWSTGTGKLAFVKNNNLLGAGDVQPLWRYLADKDKYVRDAVRARTTLNELDYRRSTFEFAELVQERYRQIMADPKHIAHQFKRLQEGLDTLPENAKLVSVVVKKKKEAFHCRIPVIYLQIRKDSELDSNLYWAVQSWEQDVRMQTSFSRKDIESISYRNKVIYQKEVD